MKERFNRVIGGSGVWMAVVVILATAFLAGQVNGEEVFWKGGGVTSAWSDGTNWDGGVPPVAGEVAVIQNGKTAIVGEGDVELLNSLAGVTISGVDSTLCISNCSPFTMTVPLTGDGCFRVQDAPGTSSMWLDSDNRNFSGCFSITNSGLLIKNQYALGGENGGEVTVDTLNGSRWITFDNPARMKFYNKFSLAMSGGTFIANNPVEIHGDVDIRGSVTLHGNSSDLGFYGAVSRISNATIYLTNGVRFYGVVDFKDSYSGIVYAQYANISLGGGDGNIKSFGNSRLTGTVKFLATNVLAAAVGYYFGLGSDGNPVLDLNGFDQRIAELWALEGPKFTCPAVIKSDKPATLTMHSYLHNDNSPYHWRAGGRDAIQGKASLVLNADRQSAEINQQVYLCDMDCSTSGRLGCEKGKFTVESTVKFANLTALDVSNVGKMIINSADINPVNGLEVIAVTNTASMTLGADVALKTVNAYLDSTAKLEIAEGKTVTVGHRTFLGGEALPPGVYGKVGGKYADGSDIPARYQLACLTGDGWLDTNGPKGMMLIFR